MIKISDLQTDQLAELGELDLSWLGCRQGNVNELYSLLPKSTEHVRFCVFVYLLMFSKIVRNIKSAVYIYQY
jgi:hypothetical protein